MTGKRESLEKLVRRHAQRFGPRRRRALHSLLRGRVDGAEPVLPDLNVPVLVDELASQVLQDRQGMGGAELVVGPAEAAGIRPGQDEELGE